jgi:predicted SAM-dependent methyltransferase
MSGVVGPSALSDYLEFIHRREEELRSSKATDSRLRRLTKQAVPPRFRFTARRVLTDVVAPAQRRRAANFFGRDPLLLHLGCGGRPKRGWVNIDLLGDPVDVAWNLTRELPFPDECADGVFHEHLLEHLTLEEGLALTAECSRVLKPGGILRIGVPDIEMMIRSYVVGGTGYLAEYKSDRPTPLLALQEMFYGHRHRAMYDVPTLAALTQAAGLGEAIAGRFGEELLGTSPDSPERRYNTLYVAAKKPV